MRISDWSSDVCSSDLAGNDGDRHFRQSAARRRHGHGARDRRRLPGRLRLQPRIRARVPQGADGAGGRGAEVRKSVVEGKSVSVSVDLGCRRIIKKKKKNSIAQYNNNKTDNTTK